MKKITAALASAAIVLMLAGASFAGSKTRCCNGGKCCPSGTCCKTHRAK